VWLFLSVKSITLKRIAVCLMFTLMLTFGISFLLLTKPASLKRGDAAITTLTGRTEFWKGCLVLIQEQPVQGYGFGVAGKIWEDPRFYREGEFLWVGSAKSSLHNGYLSLAIGLGVVGFLTWLTFISIPILQVLSLDFSPYKAFLLAMIGQLLVLNIFESSLSSGSQIHTSLIFWFILIIAGRVPQLLGRQPEIASKTDKERNIGLFHSTPNISAGLCPGHPGT
jgi:O-antigen ligase